LRACQFVKISYNTFITHTQIVSLFGDTEFTGCTEPLEPEAFAAKGYAQA